MTQKSLRYIKNTLHQEGAALQSILLRKKFSGIASCMTLLIGVALKCGLWSSRVHPPFPITQLSFNYKYWKKE